MSDEALTDETLIEAQIPEAIKSLEAANKGEQTRQSALLRIMFNLHKAQKERNPLAMAEKGFDDYQVAASWGTEKYGNWSNASLLEGVARACIGDNARIIDFLLPLPDGHSGYSLLEWREFGIENGERQYIIGNAGDIRVYPTDPEGLRFAEDTGNWQGTEHYWAKLLEGVDYPVSVELGQPGHSDFIHLVTPKPSEA